jgi:hypothetical protein
MTVTEEPASRVIDSRGKLRKMAKFKVAVSNPPKWKILGVAKFKKQQARSKRLGGAAESSNIPPAGSVAAAVVTGSVEDAIKSMPSPAANPESQSRLVTANNNIQRELESLQRNSALVRKEMQSLTQVQSSLLWLLKKATLFETQRSHGEAT